jgi:hypothetical protein
MEKLNEKDLELVEDILCLGRNMFDEECGTVWNRIARAPTEDLI